MWYGMDPHNYYEPYDAYPPQNDPYLVAQQSSQYRDQKNLRATHNLQTLMRLKMNKQLSQAKRNYNIERD